MFPKTGIDLWRVFYLPIPKYNVVITHTHEDQVFSPQYTNKYAVISDKSLWNKLNMMFLGRIKLIDPEEYNIETRRTFHYNIGEKVYVSTSFIYSKPHEFLIIPETNEFMDKYIIEYQPNTLFITIQPAPHMPDGLRIGRFAIPINDIRLLLNKKIILLSKPEYGITPEMIRRLYGINATVVKPQFTSYLYWKKWSGRYI